MIKLACLLAFVGLALSSPAASVTGCVAIAQWKIERRYPPYNLRVGAPANSTNHQITYWSAGLDPVIGGGFAWRQCSLGVPCSDTHVTFIPEPDYIDSADNSRHHNVAVIPETFTSNPNWMVISVARMMLTFDTPDATCHARQLLFTAAGSRSPHRLFIPAGKSIIALRTFERWDTAGATWQPCDELVGTNWAFWNKCQTSSPTSPGGTIETGADGDGVDGAHGYGWTCNRSNVIAGGAYCQIELEY